MKRLRVCVVTGTRAEYGIWMPVLGAVNNSPRLQLQLLVTGMHLLKGFGSTVKDIERGVFTISERVPMYRPGEPPAASLARGIQGMGAAFRKLKPHVVMVLGVRLEMLAAGSAALAQRIPIAHVHGGETAPGIWDEQIRHALTKMAHVHFCATAAAKARIRAMGEDPAHIHQVGAPALDIAVLARENIWTHVNMAVRNFAGSRPTLLLHPSSADESLEYRRALTVLDVLRKVFPGTKIETIGPNNDPGHKGILRAYNQRAEHLRLEMSSSQEQFWASLISGGMLVGNSSAGIIEAATLRCAVVNIGHRQAGRERNGNVIDVSWESGAAGIERAIRHAITDKAFRRRVESGKNLYGEGRAGKRIATVLERLAHTGIPLEKRFVNA